MSRSSDRSYQSLFILEAWFESDYLGTQLTFPFVIVEGEDAVPELHTDSVRGVITLGLHEGAESLLSTPVFTLEKLIFFGGVRSPLMAAGPDNDLYQLWRLEAGAEFSAELISMLDAQLMVAYLSPLFDDHMIKVDAIDVVFEPPTYWQGELGVGLTLFPLITPRAAVGGAVFSESALETDLGRFPLDYREMSYFLVGAEFGLESLPIAFSAELQRRIDEEETSQKGLGELVSGTHTLLPFGNTFTFEVIARF